LTTALVAGAFCGGCSTLDSRPTIQKSEAAQDLSPPVTVRGQDGEPAPAALPPTPIPAAETVGASPDEGAPGDAGTGPATSAGSAATTGVLDTALESLFGSAPIADWTPLSFATLFTEGWNRPFVFSPASDGGALRQEWINSANGAFYRQFVLDYNYRDHTTPTGHRDIGTWSVFAPLSRRLELFITVPFVDYHAVDNPTASSGGRGNLSSRAASPATSYVGTFGDITITLRPRCC
jgi:hypothetical protein